MWCISAILMCITCINSVQKWWALRLCLYCMLPSNLHPAVWLMLWSQKLPGTEKQLFWFREQVSSSHGKILNYVPVCLMLNLYTSTTFTYKQVKLYSSYYRGTEKERLEAKFSFCFNPLSKFTSCFTQASANCSRDYLLNMYNVSNSVWTNT